MSNEKPQKGFWDLFDFNHPFYKPLGIRVTIVAILIGWALLELSTGATFWAGLLALWGWQHLGALYQI